MEPVYDLFHAIQHHASPPTSPKHPPSTTPPFIYIRQTPTTIDLLHNTSAYTTTLTPPAPTATLRGTRTPPTPSLLTLLLTIPTTTAALHPAPDPHLTLHTTDAGGVQLTLTLPLAPTPASPLLSTLHTSLFAAVAALDALLSDAPDGRDAPHLDPRLCHTPLSALRLAQRPLRTRDAPLPTAPVFRRAAAAHAPLQAARALRIAAAAAAARKDIEALRARRREAQERKKVRERQLLREARRRVVPAAVSLGRKGASLFADVELDDELVQPSVSAEGVVASGAPLVEGVAGQVPGGVRVGPAVVKDGDEVAQPADGVARAAVPPRKKRKKVRRLV